MCEYKGRLKNGEDVEVIYGKRNDSEKYFIEKIIVGKIDFTGITDIGFAVYTNEKYAVFDINTEGCEDCGLGTFLIKTMLDVLKDYDVKFVAGKLSTADYDNGNWNRSIPFYLKKLPNSYIVEAYQNSSIKYFYDMVIDDKLKYYDDMESFIKETEGKKDGYIICSLQ